MSNTFMISVAAAALMAATGLATAQGVNQKDSPSAASPRTDSAAPMNAPATKNAATPGAASKDAMPQHVQARPDVKTTGEMKADSKSTSDSTAPGTASKDMKSPSAETKAPASDSKATGELKSDSRVKASDTTTSKESKTPTADTKPSVVDSKTTGNAATSATAAPPAEKRTQITSAIKQEKVDEVTNVNFNLTVGTAVPTGVRYHPLPSRIVEIYPEWRGYEFIVVHGKYVILRPHTHEIVYIVEG
jgi:hypothetical protein